MSSLEPRQPGVFGIGAATADSDVSSLVALAADAARDALLDAGRDAGEVDRVIAGTITADDVTPGLAPGIATALGALGAGASDVGAGGAGFLYGLEHAAALIESERAEVVLVCAADVMGRLGAAAEPAAAAAAVVSHGDLDVGCPRFVLGADGAHRASLYAPLATRTLEIDAPAVERHSLARMTEAIGDALARAGLLAGDLDLLVAPLAVAAQLGVAADCVYAAPLSATASAALPLALWQAERDGRLTPGMTIGLAAFGTGFVWGAGVISWKERAEVYA